MIFTGWQKGHGMKLIGSYTSPFVRKISVLLLEKGITFEFINELPYEADNGVAQYNPLGKVPALVTEKGEYWFDSPIIAEYIELLDIAPAMLPRDPMAALKVRQLEALADGIMDAALVSVREQARPAAQQSETELLRQREKINRSLDMLESYLSDGTLKTDTVNLATIAIACAVGYLNFRRVAPGPIELKAAQRVAPGWCVSRPHLVKLVETLFQRESFARTEAPKA
ncbi:putative GST-like protein YibF [Salmonella enterica subsp. enterica serovar Wandsworth str. A4-580]|uniref:Putative GST-like protein YibF n=15 Tax=Enterobacteriaceae TaxID=543 RepID=G5SIB0_SALET|nr:putative GST-like protein YibF [Salmonella enterica subsp. enterica serovar Wandsworth str. A4-580]